MSSPISSVVVLAAGQGKRMRSELPKVLHRVCGRPMLAHVLAATRALCPQRTIVVLGHSHEQVAPYLPTDCLVAIQEEQKGTGHAVLSAAGLIPEGDMLVIPGDTPLVTADALIALVEEHQLSAPIATVLTMKLDDPTGYGRIVRFPDGSVARIVEHRDADEAQLGIKEVNSGIFILPAPLALQILRTLGTDNDQGEIYLTDVVAGLRSLGEKVAVSLVADASQLLGVNSLVELAQAEAVMGERIKTGWMQAGVIITDPGSTTIEVGVELAPGTLVRPFSTVAGDSKIEAGCDIGPCSTLVDANIGQGCILPHCYVRSTVLESGTRLRPFSVLDGTADKLL